MAIHYHNFDLLVEQSGDEFKARVLDSPAGEATATFKLPFTQSDVENFFIQIGHTRLIETSQMQKMRTFGQQLFEATFTDNVRDKLRESLSEVNRNQEGLRIRLRIADTPELANLPWEFMYDASLSRFLTLSVETPLVRYLDVPREIQPLTIRPPLQILAVISGPRDFASLDVQREWDNLQEALSKLESRGLVHLTRLEKPTLQALQRQLRQGNYHIFHFVGHGVFSKHYQDGQLLFENELKGGDPVSSRDLGILLHDHRHLRLAVLNACEGARTSVDDQFAGTAQSLILQGLPAVIAMQFRITDIAAITLAREFYAALADGYPVDAALTEARKAIKTHGNELEWGTPVLYMRSPDGQIFDVESLASQKRTVDLSTYLNQEHKDRLEKLYTEALEAYYLENWEKAQVQLQAVIDAQPDHEDAAAKLEIAKRKVQLLALNAQAAQAETSQDWDAAIEFLEQLAKQEPNFENAKSRLASAKREKQLGDLYDEAKRLTQAGKWQAVLGVFGEITTLNPKYPDPQGLRPQAERELAKVQKQSKLEKNYNDAIHAIDSGDWREAIKLLRRVRGLQAGYRESDSLLQRVEAELENFRREKSEPFFAKSAANTKHEWLTLTMFATFWLSRAIPELLLGGSTFAWIEERSNTYVAFAIYMPVFGALLGLSIWWLLRRLAVKLTRPQVLSIILSPAILITIFILGAYSHWVEYEELWIWRVILAAFGLSVGLLLTVILQQAMLSFSKKQSLGIIFGWGIAFLIGQMTQNNISDNLWQIIDNGRAINLIGLPIESGAAGLIGSIFTASILYPNRFFNWKNVLAAGLGFGLSNLLTNIIFGNYDEELLVLAQVTIWGFLGGATFAAPSKNYKRYLFLGLLGGSGMLLGQLVWTALGQPDAFQLLLLGTFFGLGLGVGTKRSSGLLILLLVGLSAMSFRGAIASYFYNSDLSIDLAMEYAIWAFGAILAGSILGVAWSFLDQNDSKPADLPSIIP